MDFLNSKDDFFKIGNIAILQKNTRNDVYDFNFRHYFDCQSVVSEIQEPVLLHMGAVDNYPKLESELESMGMHLLIDNDEHLRCSTIEKWYPVLKEKTPYTKVYDELPDADILQEAFSFPIFIKGNRQTNKHNRRKCIIENAEDYEELRKTWAEDNILFWQKAAVREYLPLLTVDDTSYPEQVPVSYEFRFFYFDGKCVGYGPYWYMGNLYDMNPKHLESALELANWASTKMNSIFIAIDLAMTAEGKWIIIEVNDAQESGFVGAEPIKLWTNIIDAAQNYQRQTTK